MKNQSKWLYLCFVLVLMVSGCSKPVKGMTGRALPSVGSTARFTNNSDLVAATEAAMHDLVTPPASIRESLRNLLAQGMSTEQIAREQIKMIDQHEKQTRELLIQAGTAFKLLPGTKVRVIGYFNHEFLPLQDSDRFASFVNIGRLRKRPHWIRGSR